ncbi:hypothetical protein ACQU0X_10960 [Pseudovibrio ascidiaceicola]|uniref:hypothetical protein n=1 Tax=Pseudovibrio ascidiaceicola TaxID=285279 RepID=UPI003D36D9E0
MNVMAYVLRQYSRQSGFIYFTGDWDKSQHTKDGRLYVNPKTSAKLEEALPITTICRAEEWAAQVNKIQHPEGRCWQAVKTVMPPPLAAAQAPAVAAVGG